MQYRHMDEQGQEQPEVHEMKMILTADEARQISAHLAQLAKEIEAAGRSLN